MNSNEIKRRRVDTPTSFPPGSIIKVKVKNFTTYSYGEFNLSPTLNMIIGPNGTGKSTLVSAICLGLAGRIDLIKRKSMKSMIKTGQTECTIEITLQNHDLKPNLVIERVFTEKESRWKINNRKSDEKSIKNLCKEFNIQLDNLCHFLPQERVAEFAGLSPEKLLLETERTIGDGLLLAMHEDLIRNDKDLVDLQEKITKTEQDYNNLIEERDRLQEEANKYQEYQTKTKELENHVMLIPYAQIQDLKNQQRHLKKERDQAKRELEKFNLNAKPIEEQLNAFKKELKQANKHIIDTKEIEKESKEKHEALKQEIQTDEDKINELIQTIGSLKTRADRKKAERDQYIIDVEELENKIKDFPNVDDNELVNLKKSRDLKHGEIADLKPQIEEIEYSLRPKKNLFDTLKSEMNEKVDRLTSTDKIVVLDNRNNRNRNVMMDSSYGAHKLLRDHPELKDQYFEAPVVSCEVPDLRYAKYIEKVIDNNTLLGISFTSKEAYNKVNNLVFKKFNVPMRVTTRTAPKSMYSREELKRFGFDGYLSDFISGPSEVLNMLNEVSKLNNIPVSHTPLSEEQLGRLLNEDNSSPNNKFGKFLSGGNLFTIRKSRYGSKQSFFITEKVPEARLFVLSGLSEHAKEEVRADIQSLKQRMQQIIAEVEDSQQELIQLKTQQKSALEEFKSYTSKLEELSKLKNLKATLQSRLKSKKELVKRLDSETKKDYSEKIVQVENKIKQKKSIVSEKMLQISQILKELSDISIQLCQAQLYELQNENKVVTAQSFLENLEDHKIQLKEKYIKAKAKYDEIKKSDAAKKIQEQSTSYTPEERQVLGALAASYLQSNTLTEINIRNKIKLLEEERSLMSTVDQSSMESLRRKLQEIEFADKELPILKTNLSSLKSRIELIHREWEPKLSDLVTKISHIFQKRFTAVASDGQVELAKADRYKDWKLQILVKFRENSDLKILDHQSQSGGERAVSTIFFIMSLQGLTDAPFRVVDEINQGMDPKNEKMAHKYLVHTACKSKSSQYFLVTPKLLTGLYYHPEMVIHCIYTGAYLDPIDQKSKSPDFLDFKRCVELTT